MRSARVLLVCITSLLCLYGALARTTYSKNSKNEDQYIKSENDISNGIPVLPIEGGYQEPEESTDGIPKEGIENLFNMRSLYGYGSGYDVGAPYYYYVYDPRAIYDPESPYYMGSEFDLTRSYPVEYAPGSEPGSDEEEEEEGEEDVPDGTIISESDTHEASETSQDGEVYVQTEEPTIAEDMVTPEQDQEEEYAEREESRPGAYWIPPENDPRMGAYFSNYMMGIPAQLQSFPMFDPEYYKNEYENYERIAAENERKREELEEQGLDANTVDNPAKFPRGGRVKRGFARMLNLRDKSGDSSAHVSGKGINGNPEKVVFNADCRGGYGGGNGGGRRNNPGNGGNGGAGDVGNGIADAAGTAQNAAGEVAGAAGDAVDAASEAAENLRLTNSRRTNNRRTGNNRNNQRRGVE